MENTIALVEDPLFLEHRMPGLPGTPGTPAPHPERPERLLAAQLAVSEAKLRRPIERLSPRDATDQELCRVHTARYIEALGRTAGRAGFFDADTYYSAGSVAAARRAAGGVLSLVDALVDGRAHLGVALVRPPGHHARPDSAMGFCLLNNVAIGAAHARARGLRRVAVVDWDVHHGNGTQEIFYSDPSVLYVSLHQFPFYPGTGRWDEVGSADGFGTTVNVPLTAGAGDETYLGAFEQIVAPVVAEYAPDLLLLSAGFDAHARDPLAAMRVSAEGYADMARKLLSALPDGGAGRIAVVLEGGYDLTGLGSSLQSTLEALDGGGPSPPPSAPLSPQSVGDLERARKAAAEHFRLD